MLLTAAVARAHEPITTKLTWTREISRIFNRRCLTCHRQGGSAPMSLETYQQARPWAKAIRDEALERRMPPWGAVKGFGEFRDDPSLSDVEISWIAEWVEGGAPEGDPLYLPPVPAAFPQPEPPPRARRVFLRDGLTLSRGFVAVGIQPQQPDANASLRVVAIRPDGSVEPLLWLQRPHAAAPKTYYFSEAIALQKDTRLRLEGSSAWLLVSAPQQPDTQRHSAAGQNRATPVGQPDQSIRRRR